MKRGEHWSVCTVLLACTGLASGAILYVGGGGAYTSIQAAIDDAAVVNDEIEVAPGTYSGPGDETENSALIDFKGKAVRLYSRDGAAVTILDGSRYQHVVRCVSEEHTDTVLEGFTITGGGWGERPSGGGMWNLNSEPIVRDCLFIKNHAYSSGGAVINVNASPILVNCAFIDNISYMAASGVANYGGNPVLVNCVFADNPTAEHGGAMYNLRTNLMLFNCLFTGNRAAYDGSAMFNLDSTVLVNHCTIVDNVIATGDENGGAIYNEDSNCTVVNSILWGNSGNQITGSPAMVIYSDVQGGWPGEGNMDADPRFVDAGAGDYRLRPDSPCVDAGTNSPPGGPPFTDLRGNPRPVDGDGDGRAIADMGAFETVAADPAQLLRELLQDLSDLDLPRSVCTGLTPKLNCALQAITDKSPKHDKTAINALQAFLREVRARRGKQIPPATADMLAGEAQGIIALLACR